MIYVNYFPQPSEISEELLVDLKKQSDYIDKYLKHICLVKMKALYYATWHFEYSPKLNHIHTNSYRGLSPCRYCGNSAGSVEWIIADKYIVPQGTIHYMEEHGVYPILLSFQLTNDDYYISDDFLMDFVKNIVIE
jgi:hypothetical protein